MQAIPSTGVMKKVLEIFGNSQKKESPKDCNPMGCIYSSLHEGCDMEDFNLGDQVPQMTKAEIKWLDTRVSRGRKEKFAEFVSLTPGLANGLLALNGDNRKLSESVAQNYAKDIVSGRWETNGESISVSQCGNLNDGQHRCRAVVIAGKSIEVLVTFGVTLESRLTTNTGKVKTAADFLSMEGVKSSHLQASIASTVMQIEGYGKMPSTMTSKPTKAEVRERVLCDELIMLSIEATRSKGAGKVASPTVLATAHYFLAKRCRDSADDFMHKLITGAELKERDPIHVAREKLIDPYKRLNKNEQLKCIYNAWNNWREGRAVKSLTHTVKKFEKLPELR